MPNIVSEMVVRVGADTTQLNKGLAAGKNQTNQFVQTMGQMGRKMTMGFTLPVAGAAVAVTKMAMDFESQMTDVFTLMDDATIASRNWSDEVLDLSKKVPQSTDVLSKGLYDIVSAGIDAGDAMDVLGIASKAATAGLTDTAVSVDAITSVLNAYGLSADHAEDVSDVLFTTIKTGKTTFAELGPAIGNVVSTAAAAGISFDEVGAALATMTISGLGTDEAVTSLNQTILSFLKPADQAKKVAADLGFDLSATALASKGLVGVMTELSEKIGITVEDMIEMEKAGLSDAEMYDELASRTGKSVEMLALLFPNIRALKGALILAKDEGVVFNEMLEEQENRLGASSAAFIKHSETAKFQWDLTISSLKATGIEIGNIVMPEIMKLVTGIGTLADKFGELPEPMQRAIVKGVGIAAIVPPMLWATASVAGMVTKIKTLRVASIGANAAALKLATGTKAMGVAAAGAAGPLGIAAVVLGAIAFGGHKAYVAMGKWVTSIDKTNKSGRRFAETLQAIAGVISGGIWTTMADRFKEIIILMKIGKEEGIGFFNAWREYSHWTTEELKEYIGVAEDVTETEADRLEGMKDTLRTLSDYAMANEELKPILYDLEQLYNDGSISIEGYEQAIDHLMSSGGDFVGFLGEEITTGQELADSMGILSDSYYDSKEAREAATKASEDHAAATDNEKKSLEELMAVMFTFYNQNASIIQSIWAYQDASEELSKWLDEQSVTTEELTKAKERLSKADLDYANEREMMMQTDKRAMELAQKHHEISQGGTIASSEAAAALAELNSYLDINNKYYGELTDSQEDYTSAQEKSKDATIDQVRNTREYAEEVLGVLGYIQTMTNKVTDLVQGNAELDASEQSVIDRFLSVREAMIHAGLAAVQMNAISYSEFEGWANHVGISTDEVEGYIQKIYDKYDDMPNLIETEIIAIDLASDTVEAIVGPLNDYEKEGVGIPTRIQLEKSQANKDMAEFVGMPWFMTAGVDLYPDDAETDMEAFIYGPPWAPVETEVDLDITDAEQKLEEFINKSREIKIDMKINPVDVPAPPGIGVGHWPGYKEGGLIRAQQGLFMGSGGPTPIIVDPPEVVLNKDQALNVVWNMANQRQGLGKSGKLDLSGKIQIQVDGEGASHLNESLISELVTTKLIKEIKEEGARK